MKRILLAAFVFCAIAPKRNLTRFNSMLQNLFAAKPLLRDHTRPTRTLTISLPLIQTEDTWKLPGQTEQPEAIRLIYCYLT